MVLTPSSMVELGFQAPDFSLPDVFSGTEKTVADTVGSKELSKNNFPNMDGITQKKCKNNPHFAYI